MLTTPLSVLADRKFEDNDENEDPNNPGTFLGDGIADLVNTGTFLKIKLVLMVVFTTLFMVLKKLKVVKTLLCSKLVTISKMVLFRFKFATISSAGGLSEGVEHNAILNIFRCK
ncbi:MAG: hypothetical protein CM15mV41_1170 [Caudoviricetes sp.]|nr:MAG: hypothetical protein CM15mV41_1170 [Caudoviricetes sp.]